MPPTIDAFVRDAATVPSRDHLRRFQFIREIASGGFGSVFLTKVMHSDGFSRLVAVKLLKSQWTDSEEVARRMRDEARLLGLLRHRNIVDVIDLTAIDGRAAVIMEYLEAVDFRTVVVNLAQNGHRLPVRAALEMASAVSSALDAAYNRPPIPGDKPLRVIHRDIKPSNIMVDDTGMVKVLDFGVARSEIENRESHTQELQFGSVDYMAPERLFFEPETPASDVYSLAATLFEILALEKFGKARGRPARHAAYVVDRLSFLRAGLGIGGPEATELEKLIGDGLAFNHEDRPTAAEFYQRARKLARMVDTDDLAGWSERVLPEMIRENQGAGPSDNPLAGQTLTEDPRAFSPTDPAPQSQSAGAADILRQGALAEMEDTGAFVPSPQTGAPAQLHGLADYEPDPEEDWDDGPTAVGGLKGPVRVPRPGNSEEARQMQSGGPRPKSAPVLPDPSDPFAHLVRSPLSPPKTPKPRAKPVPAPQAGGDTEVADSLAPPRVPVQLPGTGHYDPSAPEASEPIQPLPAPPGVTARPLEPVLPVSPPEPAANERVPPPPMVPQSPSVVSETMETEVQPTVAPPVLPVTAAKATDPSPMPAPASATPAATAPASSAPPVVAPPSAVFDASDSTNLMYIAPEGGALQLGPPTATEPEVVDDVPSAPLDQPEEATEMMAPEMAPVTPALPVLSKPDADRDEAPLPPQLPGAQTDPTPEVPSLDDVVPSSPESRYGPDLARIQASEGQGAPAPVIPGYEPSIDAVAVAPAQAGGVDAPPAVATVSAPADVLEAPAPAAPASKSKAPLVAAAGCFMFFVMGAGGLGGAYALGFLGGDTTAGTVTDATTAPAEVAAAADDTGADGGTDAAVGVADGQLRIRSGADATRKISVACGGGVKANGTESVEIAGDADGPCRVKVILDSRKRLTAQIDSPAPGSVVCFAEGSDSCTAE